jgi:hypothetical protein
MCLEVDQDDVENLVKSHNRELTTEDLQELDMNMTVGSENKKRMSP